MAEGSAKSISPQAGYDQWSDFYDQDDNPLVRLDHEEVHKRLRGLSGQRVLDVGCGTGRHTIPLVQAGAKVTGVDFSEGMLAKARAKPGADGASWVEHDLAESWPFRDGWFDVVVSCLVLEHVQDLPFFFREMARVCRGGGMVLATAMHPNLFLRGTRAGYKTTDGQHYRIAGGRHCVSDYVNAGLAAGLRLMEISERTADAYLEDSPRATKYQGWPMLLVLPFRTEPEPDHWLMDRAIWC